MAEIVNLRRARKRRERAVREDEAAGNRLRFGVNRAVRAADQAERDLTGKRLDGHRLALPAPERDG